MTKQEVIILKNVAKQASFKHCKECVNFQLVDGKPNCNFQGETLDECRLAHLDINLL